MTQNVLGIALMIREKWNIDKEYKEANIAILQDNLPSLRAKVGINQEELASIIGLSRQSYYAIENKKKSMSWSVYLALIFFFETCVLSAEMLKDLRIYPTELVVKFNDNQ